MSKNHVLNKVMHMKYLAWYLLCSECLCHVIQEAYYQLKIMVPEGEHLGIWAIGLLTVSLFLYIINS